MCPLRGLAGVVSASMPSSLRASYMLCDLTGSSDPFDTLSVSIFFFGALFWSPCLARPELAPSLFFSKTDDVFCAGRGPPPALVWGAGGGPPPAFCPDLGVGPPPEAVEVNCMSYVTSVCV